MAFLLFVCFFFSEFPASPSTDSDRWNGGESGPSVREELDKRERERERRHARPLGTR